MKFKYLLRGFGIGILFSSVILAFSFYHKGKTRLSDAEIRARAEELGMVTQEEAEKMGYTDDMQELSDRLAEEAAGDTVSEGAVASGAAVASEGAVSKEAGDSDAETEKENAGNEIDHSMAKTVNIPETNVPESEEKMEGKPPVQQTEGTGKKVSVMIEGGMYSSEVAEELEKTGLIEDAQDFDQYLCQKDYAPRIRIGTFQIPEGADYKTIARILVGEE